MLIEFDIVVLLFFEICSNTCTRSVDASWRDRRGFKPLRGVWVGQIARSDKVELKLEVGCLATTCVKLIEVNLSHTSDSNCHIVNYTNSRNWIVRTDLCPVQPQASNIIGNLRFSFQNLELGEHDVGVIILTTAEMALTATKRNSAGVRTRTIGWEHLQYCKSQVWTSIMQCELGVSVRPS
jgi:hypothetical protein